MQSIIQENELSQETKLASHAHQELLASCTLGAVKASLTGASVWVGSVGLALAAGARAIWGWMPIAEKGPLWLVGFLALIGIVGIVYSAALARNAVRIATTQSSKSWTRAALQARLYHFVPVVYAVALLAWGPFSGDLSPSEFRGLLTLLVFWYAAPIFLGLAQLCVSASRSLGGALIWVLLASAGWPIAVPWCALLGGSLQGYNDAFHVSACAGILGGSAFVAVVGAALASNMIRFRTLQARVSPRARTWARCLVGLGCGSNLALAWFCYGLDMLPAFAPRVQVRASGHYEVQGRFELGPSDRDFVRLPKEDRERGWAVLQVSNPARIAGSQTERPWIRVSGSDPGWWLVVSGSAELLELSDPRPFSFRRHPYQLELVRRHFDEEGGYRADEVGQLRQITLRRESGYSHVLRGHIDDVPRRRLSAQREVGVGSKESWSAQGSCQLELQVAPPSLLVPVGAPRLLGCRFINPRQPTPLWDQSTSWSYPSADLSVVPTGAAAFVSTAETWRVPTDRSGQYEVEVGVDCAVGLDAASAAFEAQVFVLLYKACQES